MREILFRGKRKDNGKWLISNGFLKHKDGTIIMAEYKNDEVIYTQPIIPETLGQYTGLNDKNGIKIFEGDICKNTYKPIGSSYWKHYYNLVEISYSNKGVGTKVVSSHLKILDTIPKDLIDNPFSNNPYDDLEKDRSIISSTIGVGGDNWEVTGNIHDNN